MTCFVESGIKFLVKGFMTGKFLPSIEPFTQLHLGGPMSLVSLRTLEKWAAVGEKEKW